MYKHLRSLLHGASPQYLLMVLSIFCSQPGRYPYAHVLIVPFASMMTTVGKA